MAESRLQRGGVLLLFLLLRARAMLAPVIAAAPMLPAFAPALELERCHGWRHAVRACSAGRVEVPARLCAAQTRLNARERARYMRLVQAVFGCARATPRKTLVVHVMHGVSNRLRAYASARVLASRTKRLLVLVWERDVHCASGFHDLFDKQEDDDSSPLVLAHGDDALFPSTVFRRYNYMGSGKGGFTNDGTLDGKYALIRDAATDHTHVYVRTAYVLNSQGAGNHRRPVLASQLALPLRALAPVAAVRARLLEPSALLRNARNRSVIGVHVRMVVDMHRDVPGLGGVRDVERGYAAMLPAVPYRESCHWRLFVPAMSAACGGGAACTFYVASDDALAVHELRALFEGMGHDVVSLGDADLSCSAAGERARRGPRCQQAALADQLMLARSSYFIASHWSSFSDLVRVWSPHLAVRSRCGCGLAARAPVAVRQR